MTNWTDISEVARLNREATAGPTLVEPEVGSVLQTAARIGRESQGAFDISIEPLVRLWGFLGGTPKVPASEDINEVIKRVGWDHVVLDSEAGTTTFKAPFVFTPPD
jgi:thiamine biosynthesis lipoprotein